MNLIQSTCVYIRVPLLYFFLQLDLIPGAFQVVFHMKTQPTQAFAFDLDLIATAPSVVYRMKLTNGDEFRMHQGGPQADPPRAHA